MSKHYKLREAELEDVSLEDAFKYTMDRLKQLFTLIEDLDVRVNELEERVRK